jgi:hypothetical protein
MTPTAELFTYIVGELRERGLNATKTALVKLLYLADVEAARMGLPRITSLEWILYRYGPYAFEIDEAIREIEGRNIEELTGISALGKTYKRYRPTEAEPALQISPEDRGILLRVLDRWAGESLDAILDYVYFETEPMRDAEWLKPLNFDSVKRRHPPVRLADWLASKASREDVQRLGELKRTFWEKARASASQAVDPSPPPRFDNVYEEGIKASDEPE